DKYVVYVGGSVLGNYLNFELRDLVPLAQIVPTLVPVLERYKQDRQPGEGFGDYCRRLGEEALQKLLPEVVGKSSEKAADARPASGDAARVHVNGDASRGLAMLPAKSTVTPKSETFYAGPPGEELPDYTYRYNSDGSVRETIIYYYGEDQRAS